MHVVHAQVEHDQAVAAVERGRQPPLAAERDVHREASRAQRPRDEAGDARLVVDDQHADSGRGVRPDRRPIRRNHAKGDHIGIFIPTERL